MLPISPVPTHIDLSNEFSRKRRIHLTDDRTWSSCHARELQPVSGNSLVQRLFRSLIATFGRPHHRQPAQGESIIGATAHYTPHPR
jgi:hypothetical protein